MIKVWCVCVGDKYDYKRVLDLEQMVRRNLSIPHHFTVVMDSELPGWWAKIDLHRYSHGQSSKNLYFDLDVVITGSLDPLVSYCDNWLSMPKNWAKSGHEGFQSSVMAWNGNTGEIRWDFKPEMIGERDGPEYCRNWGWYTETDGTKHWGDQEKLSYSYGDRITEIEKGLVVSYKYHCMNGLPDNARVVCFHGKPDYWEVREEWIDRALS